MERDHLRTCNNSKVQNYYDDPYMKSIKSSKSSLKHTKSCKSISSSKNNRGKGSTQSIKNTPKDIYNMGNTQVSKFNNQEKSR